MHVSTKEELSEENTRLRLENARLRADLAAAIGARNELAERIQGRGPHIDTKGFGPIHEVNPQM